MYSRSTYVTPPGYNPNFDSASSNPYVSSYAPQRDLPAVAEEFDPPSAGETQRAMGDSVGRVVQGDPKDPATKLAPGMVFPDGSRIISVGELGSSGEASSLDEPRSLNEPSAAPESTPAPPTDLDEVSNDVIDLVPPN